MMSVIPVQSIHVMMLHNCPPVERVRVSDGGGEPVSLKGLHLGSGSRTVPGTGWSGETGAQQRLSFDRCNSPFGTPAGRPASPCVLGGKRAEWPVGL